MRTARKAVAVAVALGAGALLASSAVGAAPSTVASRVPVTISASSLDVGQLVYVDTVAVNTATGTVSALELTLDQPTFHGLALGLPCVPIPIGGLTGGTTTDGTTTASQITVYATDVAATIGGNRVRLSSTDAAYPPPPPGTVLVADGTLTDPAMVAVLATAPGLHVGSLTTSAAFCTPGTAKALSGSPLTAAPTETATPEATPSPAAPGETTPGETTPGETNPGTTGPATPGPTGDGATTEVTPQSLSGATAPPAPTADPTTPDPSPTP